VLEQRARLHDLTRLAVAALGDLDLAPGNLQGMLARRVQPFDGGDLGAGHRAERDDAGSRGPALHVHRASTALADAAAELRAGEAELVADDPEQRRVIRTPGGDRPAV